MANNKEIYSTVYFDHWAYKVNLLPQEKFLIETYLDKERKTVEAGTAGGRIVLEMQKLGFKYLYGFDFVPELIDKAKQRDTTGSISFDVEDATALNYNDCSFDQLVYLQQIMCLIEDKSLRLTAFKEAYRILRKGGTAIFSFLNFESRAKNTAYLAYLVYLGTLRQLRRSKYPIQYIPWLNLDGKFNFDALLDRQPYTYWYKLEEAYEFLKKMDFEIIALGSDFQVSQGKMHVSLETLKKEPRKGMLYFVCKK